MKIIRQFILWISVLIGLSLTILAFVLACNYFYKNELLFKISDKYNTTKFQDIKNQNNSSQVKQIIKSDKQINRRAPLGHDLINENKQSFDLGDIGDFLGGYFGVLIGFAGIAFTFIAFYIQYIANIQIQDQFRLQQFENQFQKMIDMYLNNKDKFSIIGYKNPDITKVTLDKNSLPLNDKIEKILLDKERARISGGTTASHLVNRPFIDSVTKDQIVFQKFVVELKAIDRIFRETYKNKNNITEEDLNNDRVTKEKIFSISYQTFFKGLNKYSKEYEENPHIIDIGGEWMNDAFKILKNLREIYKLDGTKEYKNLYKGNEGQWKTLWLKVNYEPFKGYFHFLPQYYRNLFGIVKFVVNADKKLKLSDDDKINYLRILRSTMSDYEQVLLFYNWLSGIGEDWENDKNKFFTDFKMIHNMKSILLINDITNIFEILKVPIEKQNDFFESF